MIKKMDKETLEILLINIIYEFPAIAEQIKLILRDHFAQQKQQ